ncbi:hypothetical protein [Streptomyces collinus]|uniref:hypothetical protein n=1 Tax=Streptomyces collinus TaxID=42684 RepID=UPI0029430424|nr:hypothetical protein [Streptomyces collinus]
MASTDNSLYGVEESRTTAQFLKAMSPQPYERARDDQWTVIFADFGHDLIVHGTLPTPCEQEATEEDLLIFLDDNGMSPYQVTASDAAAAEYIVRNHFKAERADAQPWADTGNRAHDLVRQFAAMLDTRDATPLTDWLEQLFAATAGTPGARMDSFDHRPAAVNRI